MADFNESIRAAISALNAHYGRGTLREWRLFADGRIIATFEPFGLHPITRRGRLIGRTVHMFGRQRTITEGR